MVGGGGGGCSGGGSQEEIALHILCISVCFVSLFNVQLTVLCRIRAGVGRTGTGECLMFVLA